MREAGPVFVTGALGFIGRAVSDRYMDHGVAVSGVDLRSDPGREVVAGDVRAIGEWQSAASPSAVHIHTAAAVTNAATHEEAWLSNVVGTRHALDAAVATGARRFVHLSSVRVFSDRDFPAGVGTRHPVRPDGHTYVDTKIASEQVVLQAHASGEMECVIIRPADVYGPGSRPWTLIPLEMIRRRRMVLPAMGRGAFSPLYLENLVDAIELAARSDQAPGRIFTISDGTAVSTRRFFAHYSQMLGMRPPPVAPTAAVRAMASMELGYAALRGRRTEMRPGSVDYLARTGSYSIRDAREVLGYDPRINLTEGMRRTEAWLREHRWI